MEHTFKEGDKVIYSTGMWSNVVWHTSTIRKVYKTGNFVLDGDPFNQQYNQDGYTTGTGYYSSNLTIWTPERWAKIEAEKEQQELNKKCLSVLNNLSSMPVSGSKFTAANLSSLEEMAAALIQKAVNP